MHLIVCARRRANERDREIEIKPRQYAPARTRQACGTKHSSTSPASADEFGHATTCAAALTHAALPLPSNSGISRFSDAWRADDARAMSQGEIETTTQGHGKTKKEVGYFDKRCAGSDVVANDDRDESDRTRQRSDDVSTQVCLPNRALSHAADTQRKSRVERQRMNRMRAKVLDKLRNDAEQFRRNGDRSS